MSSRRSIAPAVSPRSRTHHHVPNRVVFTYSNQKYVPGKSHTGLQNNANNSVSVLRNQGIHAIAVPVDNANGLRAYLNQHGERVSHVIIQAIWMKTGDLAAICMAFPTIEFTVVLHSAYMFLEDETAAIPLLYATMDLAAQLPNLVVSCNSDRMCADLSNERAQPVTYLPNLYPTDFVQPAPRQWTSGTLYAALFCSPRPGKNMTTQTAAFGILCRQLHTQGVLYYNQGRADGGPNSWAKKIIASMNNAVAGNPFVTLVPKPWSPMAQHIQVLGSCNVSFQCSNSETFNLVTADGIAMGIPTVTSSALPWTPTDWQANPDSATDIARVARNLLWNPQAPYDGIDALEAHNAQGVQAWKQYLHQGVSGVGARVYTGRIASRNAATDSASHVA